jgi:hypothetical protein
MFIKGNTLYLLLPVIAHTIMVQALNCPDEEIQLDCKFDIGCYRGNCDDDDCEKLCQSLKEILVFPLIHV